MEENSQRDSKNLEHHEDQKMKNLHLKNIKDERRRNSYTVSKKVEFNTQQKGKLFMTEQVEWILRVQNAFQGFLDLGYVFFCYQFLGA